MIPADLPGAWRARAAALETYCPAAATAFVSCALDAESAAVETGGELLSLAAAANLSGYSADHIGRLLRCGAVPNFGRPHRPLIRRADVPMKPGLLRGPAPSPHRRGATPGEVARAIATEKGHQR